MNDLPSALLPDNAANRVPALYGARVRGERRDLDLSPAGALNRQPWIEQSVQPHPCSPR